MTEPAPEFWTTVECSVGVIAACLPPLGPLIRKAPGPRRLYDSVRNSLSTPFRSQQQKRSKKPSDESAHIIENGAIEMLGRKQTAGGKRGSKGEESLEGTIESRQMI